MPSRCTRNVTRNYFSDGTLPAEGTVCASDYPPFSDPEAVVSAFASDEERRQQRDQAWLGQILPLARQGLPYDHLLPVA